MSEKKDDRPYANVHQSEALVSIGRAIHASLVSPDCFDSNGEAANVTDGLFEIAGAIRDLAEAIRETSGRGE